MAIRAGKIARKPKKATPPAMIGMLSALFSAHDRLTTCFQPGRGIWLGLLASTPGSAFSSGASAGGWSASGRAGAWAGRSWAAWAAAARRAAFSSTRSRIRSTALSRWPMPAMTSSSAGGGKAARWAGGSVARPRPGELGEPARAGAVDGRLGGGEDGALDGRGEHHLGHLVLALQRARRVLLLGDQLPDLLEGEAGQASRQDAAHQADRPVGELGSLAQRLFLLGCARLLRQTTRPTTAPARASTAPSTTGGFSR